MRPAFPDALFDGVHWDRLLARASEVPAEAIMGEFGFEIRVGRPEPAADFCVAIPSDSELASRYIGLAHTDTAAASDTVSAAQLGRPQIDSLSDAGQRRLAREALADCLEEIASTGTFANRAIANGVTMLEYDVVDPAPGLRPPPGVFWSLAKDAGASRLGKIVPLLAIASGIKKRGGSAGLPQEPPWTAALRRVVDASSPYGRLSQVGAFVGRKRAGVRIIVAGVEREATAPLLEAVVWPGPVSVATDTVAACALPGMSLSVALDIGPGGTGPRLGLELMVPGGWPRSRYAQWCPLLDLLTAKGWCRADKAIGLKRWCGLTRLFGRRMFFLAKGINHVKIGILDDAVEAKVYLGACRRSAGDMGYR